MSTTRLLLLALALAIPVPLAGRQQPAPPDSLPRSFEVVTRLRLLIDSATAAEGAAARLATTDGLIAELRESERRVAELRALLAALLDTDFVRPERVSRLGDQAIIEDQRLDALQTRTVERLDQLGALRARWLENQRFWRNWRDALRADPDFGLVASELDEGSARAQAVLARIAEATTALMDVQQRTDALRGSTAGIVSQISRLRAERRQELLRRTEPALFSPAHQRQLAQLDWRPADVTVTGMPAYVAFFREHVGMLLLHALLLVAIALFARRVQATAPAAAAWSGLLGYPWTLAVFAAAALALQQVSLAPPLWDVFLWAVLGATGAILATRLFAAPALRRAVYFLAAYYPAFLLLEIARLPTPLFRIFTAAAAATALVLFLSAARVGVRSLRADVDLADEARRRWPLRIGAAIWGVVLLAAVLGFDALSRWVTHGIVTSAAVVFVVVLLVALLRGALASLLHREVADRPRTLRRIALPLMQRLMVIMQVVIIAAAALVLLDVWELAPSPVATWQRITAFGVSVGPVQLTAGRILLGIAVIYAAVLVSWLVRTVVESEFYRQWDLDRGVGNTINTLVHYAVITLGVLIALASLGVELQNFAIVAGALGIGIGFGLQNVVNNFVSGLILLFERPVRVGDTVIVGGEWGTITRIGLRSTVMLTFDQSEMIVPNADLIAEKVTNWTLSNPIARVIMPVGVAYGSNIADVLQLLRDAGTAHAAVLREPPPQALFVGFGDSSLDFELRVWVTEIRLRLEVRSAVLAEVERRLGQAGIEIPFPQRDLHVRSIAPPAAAALHDRGGADDPDSR